MPDSPDGQARPVDIAGPRPPDAIDMSPELGKIFGELSWTSRLQLIDQYYPTPNKTVISMDSLMQPLVPNNNDPSQHYGGRPQPPQSQQWPQMPQQPPHPQQPLPPLPPMPPSMYEQPERYRSRRADRRVGMSALRMPNKPVAGRRQTPSGDFPPTNPPHRDDDTSMKLKLFRLMYETVRDSDLKVKRAELIKTQYVNSSAFEVGYLLGDISDKYNIMSDIALTLQRLYMEWRPIEHINAYEQIANQAIEISHLIDLAKTVHKRNENTGNKN